MESDLASKLWSAVRKGDTQAARECIDSGADVAVRDTLLYYVSANGNFRMAKVLLDAGADPNGFLQKKTYTIRKDPALRRSQRSGQEAANTPLNYACLGGHIKVVNLLLEKHANPNLSNDSGQTPLHCASFKGFTEIVQKLIEAGADVNAVNAYGYTALHIAVRGGHTSVVEKLARSGADLHIRANNGNTVLHAASLYGRLDSAQILVGIQPNLIAVENNLGLLAEDTAHTRGHARTAWWLQKQTKAETSHGTFNRRTEFCKETINMGVEISLETKSTDQGKNASRLASNIDSGLFEIHSQDRQGRTLLHAAAEQNDLANIKILLERGALPTALTFSSKTPADLAREKGHLQAYNIINSKEIYETKESPEELFVALLRLITETTYYNADAATTPHDLESTDASTKGQNPSLSAVRKASSLLVSGAPLEPPGSHTCYPLHLAITANCTPLLPLLLAAGAPLTATRDGLGPVQLAWLTPDITTWVAVLVTRAVRDRIAVEMQPLDGALQAAARALLEALDGDRPWEAALELPAGSSDSVDALLFRAAKGGAATLAWWIWNSGGSAVSRHTKGATPLHAALDEGHLDAARALALHMGGNLFLPDDSGRLPISLMSSHADRIIEESLAREYTILEQEKEKAKSSASRREVLEVTFLFLVLCLEFDPQVNSSDYPDERWRTVLSWVLSLHSLDTERYKDKAAWIIKMIDTFREIWRELHSYHEENNPSCYKYHLDLVGKLYSRFLTHRDEISKLFGETDNRKQEDYICELLNRAIIKSSEKNMPLFLHLLSCVAGVKFSERIDAVCGGFPLHCAALHNNMSAARYIRSKGASPRVQDRFGNTPAHYAYMFGHQEVGDFLKTDLVNYNGLPAEHMLEGYNQYLKLYKLNSNDLQKRKMERDNTASQIIQEHLQNLKRNWMECSIDQAVKECHVDFTSGEAHEIQTAVTDFIGQVTLSIGEANSLYKGNLHMLGSSGDNVRLFCPDEFDFNIIMQSMEPPFPVNWNGELRDIPENSEVFSALEDFYYILSRCLVKCKPKNRRLAIVLPGVKKTQVGVALSLVWTGKVFPLLLVDVDVVATVRASWPPALRRPKLMPSTFDSVYLNSIGNNEWRFSFALAENAVMKTLTADKRRVFLACKLVLSALKVEKWAPRHIHNQFKYFHGRFFKIPSPKGFLLKNTFFLELEEVTDEEQWTEEHLVERMTSIFRRMCEEYTDPASQVTSWEPAAVKAYFAGPTQSPCVGFGAPEIVKFLKSLDSTKTSKELRKSKLNR
ncbi:ankyrin-3-like [Penaeus indicus]|uniref:ankyrin-3-like n=1 Tax=Penaeus indicus TaxID=29960 RepID=UPI00300D8FEB